MLKFATDIAAIIRYVVWLLVLSAVAALIVQFGARPQRQTLVALLLSAGVLMRGEYFLLFTV